MDFIRKETKIYILSGKARSGKNMVAKIIKDNYAPKKSITLSYSYYLKDYIKRITGWDGSDDTKPRELMQRLGIELIKNRIDNKLLVNRLMEDVEVFSYFYDIIIITDARLVEEIEIPKSHFKNIVTIRVNRKIENYLTEEQKKHITEIALDDYDKFDFIIDNNDNNLKEKVIKILKEVDEYE